MSRIFNHFVIYFMTRAEHERYFELLSPETSSQIAQRAGRESKKFQIKNLDAFRRTRVSYAEPVSAALFVALSLFDGTLEKASLKPKSIGC